MKNKRVDDRPRGAPAPLFEAAVEVLRSPVEAEVVRDELGFVDEIPPDSSEDVGKRALAMVTRATAFPIRDDASYTAGIELWKRMKRMSDAWVRLHDKSVKAAKAAWDEARAVRDAVADPLKTGLDDLKQRLEDFTTQRREEQKKALAASVQHDVAVAQSQTTKALAQEFDAAVDRGDNAKATRILQHVTPGLPRPIPEPPAVIPATLPKVEGVSAATPYTYDIVDESLIPREWMIPDRKAIAANVKARGERCNIPGIHVRPDTTLRISAKE